MNSSIDYAEGPYHLEIYQKGNRRFFYNVKDGKNVVCSSGKDGFKERERAREYGIKRVRGVARRLSKIKSLGIKMKNYVPPEKLHIKYFYHKKKENSYALGPSFN